MTQDTELLPCQAFHFTRYVNGVEMAEGVRVEREKTLGAAVRRAAQLAPKAPGTVLVLNTPIKHSNPDRNAVLTAAIRALKHDLERQITIANSECRRAEEAVAMLDVAKEALERAVGTLAASRHLFAKYCPDHHWLPEHGQRIEALKVALQTIKEGGGA